jgi:hypothetical protein
MLVSIWCFCFVSSPNVHFPPYYSVRPCPPFIVCCNGNRAQRVSILENWREKITLLPSNTMLNGCVTSVGEEDTNFFIVRDTCQKLLGEQLAVRQRPSGAPLTAGRCMMYSHFLQCLTSILVISCIHVRSSL